MGVEALRPDGPTRHLMGERFAAYVRDHPARPVGGG
jgi:hypothetical protein